jgi:hypothetical protein
MPTVHLSPLYNGWQGFGNTGLTLNGGKLSTFQAGTGIPATTYTTSAGTVANAFPIILDSAGRPPNEIWLAEGQAYLFILTDSLNNVLATYDNIYGIHDFVAGNPGVTFGGTVTFNGPVQVHTTSFQFTGTGSNRIQGDFSNAVIVNRVIFQTSTANGATDAGRDAERGVPGRLAQYLQRHRSRQRGLRPLRHQRRRVLAAVLAHRGGHGDAAHVLLRDLWARPKRCASRPRITNFSSRPRPNRR